MFSTTRQVARGCLFLAFRHDHRCAFFDGLLDEFVAIGFFTPQCHEHAIPLHSPRVIRDAFHRAIKWADDLANWNRGDESFELHEVNMRHAGASARSMVRGIG